jgi:hypothetical protein
MSMDAPPEESHNPHTIDYESLLKEVRTDSYKAAVSFLMENLPFVWRDYYLEMMSRETNIVRFQYGTFEYIYDDYASLEATGAVPHDPKIEARLVGVSGCSERKEVKRDDSRLRGWVGPTWRTFGTNWDKGHFIAHSIGGAVDQLEVNVFIQRRDLNRGWSDAGRRYREMEQYCKSNPGTFCFSRPIYFDQTAKPAFVEFGILKNVHALSVECFDNR